MVAFIQAEGLARGRAIKVTPTMLPWLVLAGGLLTTGLFCNSERRFNQLEHERIERTLANDVGEALQAQVRTNIALLDAVVGLFNSTDTITLSRFTTFVNSLQGSGENVKGVLGVGYAASVPSGDVKAFERAIRADGQPDFRIRPAGRRQLTTAIIYLQPNNWRNRRAIGFDMASEPVRRTAMLHAANTGEPAITGPVKLVQETNVMPQPGTLLYKPIYDTPNPVFNSVNEPLRRLRGWAYSPLRMGDFIGNAVRTVTNPDKQNAAIMVFDGIRADRGKLLFDNLRSEDNLQQAPHFTWKTISIANRNWLIGIQLDHRGLNPTGWTPALLLSGLLGASLSVLMALLSRRLVDLHLVQGEALEQQSQAAKERALAASVFEIIPDAIAVTDTKATIIRTNKAFAQISGYSELEARGQKTSILKSGKHDAAFYSQLWHSLNERRFWEGRIWNRHRNGTLRLHDVRIIAVRNQKDEVINYVELLRDVTDEHHKQQLVHHLATHDQLTGLANRNLLADHLEHSLALARRQAGQVGLLFMDLNGFKPVNDHYGHATGDALLKAIATRLLSNVRESDTLCRLGGDEFVLLVTNSPHGRELGGPRPQVATCDSAAVRRSAAGTSHLGKYGRGPLAHPRRRR